MPNGDPLTIFNIEDLERMLPARRQPFVQAGVQPFETPGYVQAAQGIADIVEAIRAGRGQRQLREAAATRRQALIDLATGGGAPEAPRGLGRIPAQQIGGVGLGVPGTIGALGPPPGEQPIGGLPPQEEPRAEGLGRLPVGAFRRFGRGVGGFFGRLTDPGLGEAGFEVPPNLPEIMAEAYQRSPAEGEVVRAAASEALGIPIAAPRGLGDQGLTAPERNFAAYQKWRKENPQATKAQDFEAKYTFGLIPSYAASLEGKKEMQGLRQKGIMDAIRLRAALRGKRDAVQQQYRLIIAGRGDREAFAKLAASVRKDLAREAEARRQNEFFSNLMGMPLPVPSPEDTAMLQELGELTSEALLERFQRGAPTEKPAEEAAAGDELTFEKLLELQ